MGSRYITLKKNNTEAAQLDALNFYLHERASRYLVWRRLVESAVEANGIFITYGAGDHDALSRLLAGRDLEIMSASELVKTVNKSKAVYCPIRPTWLKERQLDALLDSPELHVIRSYDYAQERFLKELRQRIAERSTAPRIITIRDGA